MSNPVGKLAIQNRGDSIRSLLFFSLFYLYLWLKIEPKLIYHENGSTVKFPAFFSGWTFFVETSFWPGGLAEYVSAFLSQLFYYSWLGALVIILSVWLSYIFSGFIIKAINAKGFLWLRFFAPLATFIIYTRYSYHFLETMVFIWAIGFVCIYLKVKTEKNLIRITIFLTLSVILYAIAGGAYLLFAAMCVLYELLFRRKPGTGFLYLIFALVIPYLEGVVILKDSIINSYSNNLPVCWKTYLFDPWKYLIMAEFSIYLFLPVLLILIGFWRLIRGQDGFKSRKSDAEKKVHKKKFGWFVENFKVRWAVESLILFLLAGAAALIFYDDKLKATFEADYYSCKRDWPRVLSAAKRNPKAFFLVHAANRALYYTDRLGDDMFSFGQHPDTLFLNNIKNPLAEWKKVDTYLDIGLINFAENGLTEELNTSREKPVILQRLAFINMVKGRIGAARIFLGALSKTLFWSNWAEEYLKKIDSDPGLSNDIDIQHLRGIALQNDFDFSTYENEWLLLMLLERNPKNNIAFEYLMAAYLLTNQLDKFIENLERFYAFGYQRIPRHYQEAILLYTVVSKKKFDLKEGYKLDPLIITDFNNFFGILNKYGGNTQAAARELAGNYGNSYLFYYVYHMSGVKSAVK